MDDWLLDRIGIPIFLLDINLKNYFLGGDNMSGKIARRDFLKLSALGIGALGLTTACDSDSNADASEALVIDVSCNANTIRFEGPQGPNPNDLGGDLGHHNPGDLGPHPYYGSSFVVQGVVYTGGTISGGNVDSGLYPEGTPEFPDRVIGSWICRGWFIGDSNDPSRGGIFTPTGPFVATTQIYDLGNEPGSDLLISDGIELIDLNTPFSRAVTGGTGSRNGTRGTVTQTAIGVNQTTLFNFSFEFNLV